MRKAAFSAALICVAAATAVAQPGDEDQKNWPHWRGPLVTGASPSGNPPTTWDEKTNIKWKVAIPGKGSASPIVWGDKLFLLTAIETQKTALLQETQPDRPGANATQDRPEGGRRGEGRGRGGPGGPPGGGGRGGFGGGAAPISPYQFVVLCLDRNTGKILWKQVAREEVPHEGAHNTNTFASASAVTDGKLLYASFGSRGLYCYDLDGNLKWDVDLGDMQTRNSFGEGATPALHGDTLIVPWDHEGQDFVVALDAKTGEEKWRQTRDEPTTWSTPLVVPRGDGWQVVLSGTNRVRSYDLETGDTLWECGGQTTNVIPIPVANDEFVFAMSGFRGAALYAIPLDATGDLTDSDKVAWKRSEGTPYISSPVLSNGLLYFTKDRNAILTCVEAATGKEVYSNQRLPDMNTLYSSPVAAGGNVYFFSREGTGVVVKEGREFEVVATNKLDETIDASPAVVGDTMYVRGEKSLYCIGK